MKVKINNAVYENLSDLRKAVTTKQFFIGIKRIDIPELQNYGLTLQILDENDNLIEEKKIINVSQSIDYLAGITHLVLQYE